MHDTWPAVGRHGQQNALSVTLVGLFADCVATDLRIVKVPRSRDLHGNCCADDDDDDRHTHTKLIALPLLHAHVR